MRNHPFEHVKRLVRTRDELLADGWAAREIDRTGTAARLRRVHRNRYVSTAEWSQLWPETRHRIEVYAATAEMRGGAGVVSHISAAAWWGLPLFRRVPVEVEFTVRGRLRAATRSGIRRHLDRLDQADVVVRDGIRCTSLERTVFDVARRERAEVAIVCLDAALRTASFSRGQWDAVAEAAWRVRMSDRAREKSGARGIRQARWLIEIAEGRSQSPGESVSRLQLTRLGFARPLLQVPVPGPAGRTFWVDLGLADAQAFGEFDGKDKYLDEAMRSGRTVEEVLLEEKAREDWIRGTTQWRFARWGDEHIVTPEALRVRLAAFGIHPHR